ncbi:MAG: hypothetical protein IH987_07820 [Planctomycetes bacterium]|nr:hypothetical protein [Planctomycetota bacterium]
MKHKIHSQCVRPIRHLVRVCRLQSLVSATVLFAASMAVAAPPIQPTLPPFYTFDAESPSVSDGTVGSGDILVPGPNDAPIIVLRGTDLGLPEPGDEIDACSGPSRNIGSGDTFTILISVHRESVGSVPPDPNLVAQGVPYNVTDQAEKGQAAGDQCMSLDLFTRAGGPLPGSNGRAGDNNALIRNNYDEGGTDFGAKPETSAAETAAARVPQDNVNCMFGTGVPTDPRGPADLLPIYFSASTDSPSLQLLPAAIPSGANIFFHGVTQEGGPPQTRPYASFSDLGLVQDDDITGMIVFDAGGDEFFQGQDQIVFSLAPDSPSLITFGGPGKAASSADVFSVDASGNAVIFIAAAGLGLGAADVISAVDFLTCTDATACALRHAIRAEPLVPAVSTWGMIVMTVLMLVAGTLVRMRRRASAA